MRLALLLVLSVGLGLLGLYLGTREELFSAALYVPKVVPVYVLVTGVLCLAALWWAPVVKLVLLARSQGLRLGWWHAFLAHVAQVFGTAMTPSGTGGAPFLVVALERVGVPVGAGLAMAVQLFVLDLTALGLLIPLGLAYILLATPIVLGSWLTFAAAAAAVASLVVSVLLARFPRPVVRGLHGLSRWRPLRRFRGPLRRVAAEYRGSATAFRDLPIPAWFWLHVATFTGWLTSFALFWALLVVYGANVGLLDVLALLSMVTLLSFFVPTPGAAGVMEFLLGLAVGATGSRLVSVAAPVLLWRASTFYVAYLLGPISAWLLLSRRAGAPSAKAVGAGRPAVKDGERDA